MNINPNVIRNASLISVGVGVAGGLGYVVGVNVTKRKYESLIDEEIQSVKDTYSGSMVTDNSQKPFPTPQEAAAALINVEEESDTGFATVDDVPQDIVEKIAEYEGTEEPQDMELRALSEGSHNVFDQPDRSAEKPYIISVDEFMQDDSVEGFDMEKITLTYYEGDDTLVDEREQMVPDVEGTVGSIHLTMFGDETKKYSKDPNIVYVRNERLHADFEVARDERSFSVFVLGMDPDIVEGLEKQQIKRMRSDG